MTTTDAAATTLAVICISAYVLGRILVVRRGLGTQLRHLIDLLDGAVAATYEKEGMTYRPRYTPIMRALLLQDSLTVTQLAVKAGITQPAATQTVALMIQEGLLFAEPSAEDNRQKIIRLTAYGNELVPRLQACWDATTSAANSLDSDLPFPISRLLDLAIESLERDGFAARIESARKTQAVQRLQKKHREIKG